MNDKMKTAYDRALMQATGKSLEQMRNTSIADQRIEIEEKQGKAMRFVSHYPLIGRGTVLCSRVVSHEQVEKLFKEAVQ